MLNEYERKEIESLHEQISNLQEQLDIHKTLLIALMSELSISSIKNFSPFDTAIRNHFKEIPAHTDTHYGHRKYIEQCIEEAERVQELTPVR
ncbi:MULTISPECIES: hypothetical protein [Photorhabdus]|uniref:Uncharacterized protein n=1 Tax=Photorhabdus asymbiotica TaxID=291112 RepID=A0ABX9STG8_9GAMM|nr:hypothetical protein [Photorhabdus asymbiotica]RKS66744.1 hypothetical protein BDD30_1083 [Photorhabdus asymbiotica]